jgi:hypothetical protein
MIRYILSGVGSGILFGLLDGLINGNAVAQRLYKVFEPIARKSISVPAGLAIDLVCGFAMAGIYLLLYGSLPGPSGVFKGLVFGLLVWFFRVAMQVASQWMMFSIPANTLLYNLACGLCEMIVLGLFYGLTLWPAASNS